VSSPARLRLTRTAYKLAWLGLWLLAPLHRGRGRGVKAILSHDGNVLLVQHTYGPKRWELPGGGLHRREAPLDGIRREIREELGVDLAHAELIASGRGPGRQTKRRMSYFSAELSAPEVIPDAREIARAQWFAPGALPPRLGAQVAVAVKAWASGAGEPPARLSA